jgi:hypothetical protein
MSDIDLDVQQGASDEELLAPDPGHDVFHGKLELIDREHAAAVEADERPATAQELLDSFHAQSFGDGDPRWGGSSGRWRPSGSVLRASSSPHFEEAARLI